MINFVQGSQDLINSNHIQILAIVQESVAIGNDHAYVNDGNDQK